MPAAEVALRTLLGVVFGVAFVAKVRSSVAFGDFARSLADIGWLRGRHVVALIIPALEATTVVLLAVPRTVVWGFGACVLLLSGFTSVTGREVARGRRVRCRCFGADGATIGPAAIARNLVLLTAAAAGLAIGPFAHGAASAAALVYACGPAVLAALVIMRWDDLAGLVRAS